jgi:hypothetical protein
MESVHGCVKNPVGKKLPQARWKRKIKRKIRKKIKMREGGAVI